jgi:uncharacterized protein
MATTEPEPLLVIVLSLVPYLAPKGLTLGRFFRRFFVVMAGLRNAPARPKVARMNDYSDSYLKEILTRTKVVAMVGVSMNPVRPSYFVARYLGLRGFTVIPVNPGHAGKMLFGQTVRGSLAEVDAAVDMVDIFRRSDAVPPIVDEALEVFPDLKTIWMQIGVSHPEAAAKAEARGVSVIQNRCPKIEYQRLFGELRMGGFNTGVISSKL